ncbi:hypothetical protein GC197_10670 [bacterium]|nr:hypothetical protein [bacterium]
MPDRLAARITRRLQRGLTGLLLPGSCCLCRQEVARYRDPDVLCEPCQTTIQRQGKCPRCSAVLVHENRLPSDDCPACYHLKLPFAEITSVGNYEGALREAILKAKQRGGASTAWDLGQLLSMPGLEGADLCPVLVPVPMYWTRRLRRGSNTAEILAQSMASRWKWPISRLVTCQRSLAKQSELPFSERKSNVRGAFAAQGPIAADRPIVLIDDIMTTGATVTELQRVLRQAGATDVRVAVVARSVGMPANA